MKAYTITYKTPEVDLVRGIVFDAPTEIEALDRFDTWCVSSQITPIFLGIEQMSDWEQRHHNSMTLPGASTVGD